MGAVTMRKIIGVYVPSACGVLIILWVIHVLFHPMTHLRIALSLFDEVTTIAQDGLVFRDLNKNGQIDPYEDHRLPTDVRSEDLLTRMTVAEKVGQMFHPPLVLKGSWRYWLLRSWIGDNNPTIAQIFDQHMTHFNFYGQPSLLTLAHTLNDLQRIAERTRLGIPLTISSDPIHAVERANDTAGFSLPGFSQWPSPLGFAAARNPFWVGTFASVAAAEYRAVGLTTALHPMADLATEPRWARNFGTFGSNAFLASLLTINYMHGFQGDNIGKHSVITMVKHFPGGGPQKDGWDARLLSGNEQVYPGNNFDYHVLPFRAAMATGNFRALMPSYAIPVDQGDEDVAVGFNRFMLTDILRQRLRFTGVICTDWGIISGQYWGVEHLSIRERYKKSIDAGVDQYGGEENPSHIIDMVQSGEISVQRIDQSVRRILHNKFDLGLFDQPYVDTDQVEVQVNTAESRAQAIAAQYHSVVLLNNKEREDGTPILPASKGKKIFVDGLQSEVAQSFGELVDTPAQADYTILYLPTVFNGNQPLGRNRLLDKILNSPLPNNDLQFPPAIVKKLEKYAQYGNLITVVNLNRPAILHDIDQLSHGLIATFGVSDEVILGIVFGDHSPTGALPFEIPRSMEAAAAQQEDVADDTTSPTFPYGHGLTY